MNDPNGKIVEPGRFRSTPHPTLRPFVVEYWGLARDLAAMGGFTITPDRFGELVCCADDLFAVRDGVQDKLPPCFLVGLLDGPLRIEAAGVVRCMGARLHPWTLGGMLSAESQTRGWSDAGGLLGDRLAGATEMVRRREWTSLVDLFDEVLIEEVGRRRFDATSLDLVEPFLGAERRSTAFVAAQGSITGRRQVERRVRDLTGTSPKQLACLARFQAARDAIWADPTADLCELAAAIGYADQSHMTRQFRKYAGQTPADFARSSAAKKKWLAAEHVAFVQEGAKDDA